MRDDMKFYIDGHWVEAHGSKTCDVINPANEQVVGKIALGNTKDVDLAVNAAQRAFPEFSNTSREERIDLLERILAAYMLRFNDIAEAIMLEMGAPWTLAKTAQAGSGIGHLKATIRALKNVEFEHNLRNTLVRREAIGVVALITPWNWPINQIACKVAPALAAGCTMVLKPSEIAPLDATIFAEVLHTAGVPPGVFNLIHGDGATVGTALCSHPDVAMVSFTGSTRAGVQVASNAAATVKRVAQELGGKSANILLDDADFDTAVRQGAADCFENTGQSCNAPTRMLVPSDKLERATRIAADVAKAMRPGEPRDEDTNIGPLVSQTQWDKVQSLIKQGIQDGATLAAGGPGRPAGLTEGYFVKPTVFSDVDNSMVIAREEIFGPVLAILPYATDDDAVAIANDTSYGLSNYVSSGDLDRARAIAMRLESGMVHINYASLDTMAPFGGYKQSGNGREWGVHGIEEFLETKSIFGYNSS